MGRSDPWDRDRKKGTQKSDQENDSDRCDRRINENHNKLQPRKLDQNEIRNKSRKRKQMSSSSENLERFPSITPNDNEKKLEIERINNNDERFVLRIPINHKQITKQFRSPRYAIRPKSRQASYKIEKIILSTPAKKYRKNTHSISPSPYMLTKEEKKDIRHLMASQKSSVDFANFKRHRKSSNNEYSRNNSIINTIDESNESIEWWQCLCTKEPRKSFLARKFDKFKAKMLQCNKYCPNQQKDKPSRRSSSPSSIKDMQRFRLSSREDSILKRPLRTPSQNSSIRSPTESSSIQDHSLISFGPQDSLIEKNTSLSIRNDSLPSLNSFEDGFLSKSDDEIIEPLERKETIDELKSTPPYKKDMYSNYHKSAYNNYKEINLEKKPRGRSKSNSNRRSKRNSERQSNKQNMNNQRNSYKYGGKYKKKNLLKSQNKIRDSTEDDDEENMNRGLRRISKPQRFSALETAYNTDDEFDLERKRISTKMEDQGNNQLKKKNFIKLQNKMRDSSKVVCDDDNIRSHRISKYKYASALKSIYNDEEDIDIEGERMSSEDEVIKHLKDRDLLAMQNNRTDDSEENDVENIQRNSRRISTPQRNSALKSAYNDYENELEGRRMSPKFVDEESMNKIKGKSLLAMQDKIIDSSEDNYDQDTNRNSKRLSQPQCVSALKSAYNDDEEIELKRKRMSSKFVKEESMNQLKDKNLLAMQDKETDDTEEDDDENCQLCLKPQRMSALESAYNNDDDENYLKRRRMNSKFKNEASFNQLKDKNLLAMQNKRRGNSEDYYRQDNNRNSRRISQPQRSSALKSAYNDDENELEGRRMSPKFVDKEPINKIKERSLLAMQDKVTDNTEDDDAENIPRSSKRLSKPQCIRALKSVYNDEGEIDLEREEMCSEDEVINQLTDNDLLAMKNNRTDDTEEDDAVNIQRNSRRISQPQRISALKSAYNDDEKVLERRRMSPKFEDDESMIQLKERSLLAMQDKIDSSEKFKRLSKPQCLGAYNDDEGINLERRRISSKYADEESMSRLNDRSLLAMQNKVTDNTEDDDDEKFQRSSKRLSKPQRICALESVYDNDNEKMNLKRKRMSSKFKDDESMIQLKERSLLAMQDKVIDNTEEDDEKFQRSSKRLSKPQRICALESVNTDNEKELERRRMSPKFEDDESMIQLKERSLLAMQDKETDNTEEVDDEKFQRSSKKLSKPQKISALESVYNNDNEKINLKRKRMSSKFGDEESMIQLKERSLLAMQDKERDNTEDDGADCLSKPQCISGLESNCHDNEEINVVYKRKSSKDEVINQFKQGSLLKTQNQINLDIDNVNQESIRNSKKQRLNSLSNQNNKRSSDLEDESSSYFIESTLLNSQNKTRDITEEDEDDENSCMKRNTRSRKLNLFHKRFRKKPYMTTKKIFYSKENKDENKIEFTHFESVKCIDKYLDEIHLEKLAKHNEIAQENLFRRLERSRNMISSRKQHRSPLQYTVNKNETTNLLHKAIRNLEQQQITNHFQNFTKNIQDHSESNKILHSFNSPKNYKNNVIKKLTEEEKINKKILKNNKKKKNKNIKTDKDVNCGYVILNKKIPDFHKNKRTTLLVNKLYAFYDTDKSEVHLTPKTDSNENNQKLNCYNLINDLSEEIMNTRINNKPSHSCIEKNLISITNDEIKIQDKNNQSSQPTNRNALKLEIIKNPSSMITLTTSSNSYQSNMTSTLTQTENISKKEKRNLKTYSLDYIQTKIKLPKRIKSECIRSTKPMIDSKIEKNIYEKVHSEIIIKQIINSNSIQCLIINIIKDVLENAIQLSINNQLIQSKLSNQLFNTNKNMNKNQGIEKNLENKNKL